MTLRGVIARFKTDDYKITRVIAGTYTNGVLVPGIESEETIEACVQPVSGRELQQVPEAQHGEELRVVYTVTELMPRRPGSAGDRITIDDEEWTCIRSERWEAFGETHWRAFVARQAVP